jgi:hypothetical protein
MFSPQFFDDLKLLRRKGLSATEIGERLRVSSKIIQKRLKQGTSQEQGRELPNGILLQRVVGRANRKLSYL